MHAICLSLAYQTKLGTMVTDQRSEGPPVFTVVIYLMQKVKNLPIQYRVINLDLRIWVWKKSFLNFVFFLINQFEHFCNKIVSHSDVGFYYRLAFPKAKLGYHLDPRNYTTYLLRKNTLIEKVNKNSCIFIDKRNFFWPVCLCTNLVKDAWLGHSKSQIAFRRWWFVFAPPLFCTIWFLRNFGHKLETKYYLN